MNGFGYLPRRASSAGLLVAVVGVLALSPSARAGTISVTTTFDQRDGVGPCSLREAVDTANLDVNSGGCTDSNPAAADTIRLTSGDYHLTRWSGPPEDVNAAGDLDVSGTVTIVGAGAGLTAIDGNGLNTGDRVLHVSAGTLTVSGVTVHGGRGIFGGGGILGGAGTTVRMNDATVSDNFGGENGGGIAAPTVSLTRTTVSRNRAGSGGGIHADTVTLVDSNVSGNEANLTEEWDGGDGGGIWAWKTATLTRSTVVSNTAGDDGGGLWAQSATLAGSTVEGNSARAGMGGGLYSDVEVRLSASRVGANTAGDGGGILSALLTLTDTTVHGNTAFGSGGGVYAFTAATLTRSTVSDNQADTGGGIRMSGTASLVASSVQGNFATTKGGGIAGAVTATGSSLTRNRTNGPGGGLYTDTGSSSVTRSTIVGNYSADFGGGIFFTSAGSLDVTNSTLSGNHASGFGGGLATEEGTTTLLSSTVTRNVADGGGFAAFSPATVRLGNTILGGNFDETTDPELHDWYCPLATKVSLGHNLLPTANDCSMALASGDVKADDARLAPLADNGAGRLTHVLLAGSPAINTGNPATPGTPGACPSTDERGVPRTLGGRCDKGAYERASCRSRIINRVGTSGADTIIGTSAADGILALGGNDVLRGGAGGDGLCGGTGNDTLFGEAGADVLDGSHGTDTCDGGTETDQAILCETIASIP